MNSLMRLWMVVYSLLTGFTMLAQGPAPELYCISADTIRWSIPTSSCGPFVSYDIYESTALSGPYTLLANINDPAQTSFVRSTSPGGTIYYYMTTTAICAGIPVQYSDTLDNASPLPAQIRSVSVNGSDILLSWQPGASPETYAYIIYKGLEGGSVVPLDTVMGLSYTDSGRFPADSVYSYYITSIDRCGGTSIFSQKHSSIRLSGSVDTCARNMNITFTPYEGWQDVRYDILVSEDGGAETIAGTTMANTFFIGDLPDQMMVCVRIRAYNATLMEESFSNILCVQTKQGITLSGLCLTSIGSSSTGNQLDFTFETNDDARLDVLEYGTSREKLILNFEELQSVAQPYSTPDLNFNKPATEINYFRLSGTDACGNLVHSGYANNIVLHAQLKPNNEVTLTWNPLDWESGVLNNYEVRKINIGGNNDLLATGDVSMLEFHDPIVPGLHTEVRFCYQITASVDINCGDETLPGIVHSNIACVEKDAGFFMPNAFIPGGVSPEFKPVLYFEESMAAFSMIIFDRFGGKIFETTDAAAGWDGTTGGRQMPAGLYAYLIRVESLNGKVKEQRGSVVLIR